MSRIPSKKKAPAPAGKPVEPKKHHGRDECDCGLCSGKLLDLIMAVAPPEFILNQFTEFCIGAAADYLRTMSAATRKTRELCPDEDVVTKFAVVGVRTTKRDPEPQPFIVSDMVVTDLLEVVRKASVDPESINHVATVSDHGIESIQAARSPEEAMEIVRAYEIARNQNHKVTKQ